MRLLDIFLDRHDFGFFTELVFELAEVDTLRKACRQAEGMRLTTIPNTDFD